MALASQHPLVLGSTIGRVIPLFRPVPACHVTGQISSLRNFIQNLHHPERSIIITWLTYLQVDSDTWYNKKGKVRPCTGTEALCSPYGS